jgi:hypothetical protein
VFGCSCLQQNLDEDLRSWIDDPTVQLLTRMPSEASKSTAPLGGGLFGKYVLRLLWWGRIEKKAKVRRGEMVVKIGGRRKVSDKPAVTWNLGYSSISSRKVPQSPQLQGYYEKCDLFRLTNKDSWYIGSEGILHWFLCPNSLITPWEAIKLSLWH